MDWQDRFREVLTEEFELAKRENPRLSLRQWADRIQMSSGALSEILAGRRRVTAEKARAIVTSAGVASPKLKALLALMGAPTESLRRTPSVEELKLVESWENLAICGMYELSGVEVTTSFIASRLKLSEEEVESRTMQLIDGGLISVDESGRRMRVRQNWDLRDAIPNDRRTELRQRSLDLSRAAMGKVNSDASLFLDYTYVGRPEHVQYLKTEMLRICNHLEALGNFQPSTDVVRLSVQLFPFEFSETLELDKKS